MDDDQRDELVKELLAKLDKFPILTPQRDAFAEIRRLVRRLER